MVLALSSFITTSYASSDGDNAVMICWDEGVGPTFTTTLCSCESATSFTVNIIVDGNVCPIWIEYNVKTNSWTKLNNF